MSKETVEINHQYIYLKKKLHCKNNSNA